MITYLITFLIGVATGAGAVYFADKFTDQRRRREAHRDRHERFRHICSQMPSLIDEIRKDLSSPEMNLVREFFLVSRTWVFSAGKAFVYYFEDHPDLKSKAHILENSGYIVDVTGGNTTRYRLTEDFVALILNDQR